MADPRIVKHNERKDTRSDLMKSVIAASMSRSEAPNFCPYGCEDHELDDNGYCHHLVGFTNGGDFYEPRAINHLGKEFVDGTNRKPMKKGFYRERITTSARVYSRKGNPALAPVTRDVADKNAKAIEDKEREYAELLERLKTPALSGVFEGSEYDVPEPYNPEDGLDAASE